MPIDVASDRLVVLSDMHRGKRDRADDFRRCESAYTNALAHYDRERYTLALLGDVEELWKNRVDSVIAAYEGVYAAESSFHADGRLIRFWGNHDEEWASPAAVRDELGPAHPGAPLEVRESLLLDVRLGDRSLGPLFLVHGHQGTGMSDGLAFLARFTVRFLWRPIQHLTAVSRNTPSKNRKVRERHHRAMRRWAEGHESLLLIAGHTHRPVFASVAIVDELERRLGLDMEEIRVSGKEPQNQLSASLVGGRDFVSERLALEESAAGGRIQAAQLRLERIQDLEQVGAIGPTAGAQGIMALLEAETVLGNIRAKLELRQRFLDGEVSEEEAERERELTETEAEADLLRMAFQEAGIRYQEASERFNLGVVHESELERARLDLMQLETRLEFLEVKLAALRGGEVSP